MHLNVHSGNSFPLLEPTDFGPCLVTVTMENGDDDVMQLGGDDDECTSRLSMFILATAWNEAKVLRIVFDAWLFCSQRRLLRPTNPYVVFVAGKHI